MHVRTMSSAYATSHLLVLLLPIGQISPPLIWITLWSEGRYYKFALGPDVAESPIFLSLYTASIRASRPPSSVFPISTSQTGHQSAVARRENARHQEAEAYMETFLDMMRAKLANLKADGHDAFAFVAWIDCILALIHPFTDESPGFSTAAEAGLPCVGVRLGAKLA
ncbi:hypothetical protein C8T65DRAFT_237920 [Cerioporus squamosus]|nr:hypothetical protein C8T65DRAFT_237920 [Cerioporus squamosus]